MLPCYSLLQVLHLVCNITWGCVLLFEVRNVGRDCKLYSRVSGHTAINAEKLGGIGASQTVHQSVFILFDREFFVVGKGVGGGGWYQSHDNTPLVQCMYL